MKFHIRSELDYIASTEVTFLLNIRPRISSGQKIEEERFTVTPDITHQLHLDPATGNRFDHLTAPMPGIYHIRYEAIVETHVQKLDCSGLRDEKVHEFCLETLSCVYPSRYCQSDRLGDLAMRMFGHLKSPLEQARAVVAWISENVAYVSGSTSANTSAVDTLVERKGVCRDFAHLGIALCRALNIPARYFTGYAHDLSPPDFHACFETWTGGHWLLWDATGLASPDAVVHIGTGRDAADVSVCTSFGPLMLQRQTVACEVLEPGYVKLEREELQRVCISHS